MAEFTSHAEVISVATKHKLLTPALKGQGRSVKGSFAATALDQLCTDTDPLTPQSTSASEDSSVNSSNFGWKTKLLVLVKGTRKEIKQFVIKVPKGQLTANSLLAASHEHMSLLSPYTT